MGSAGPETSDRHEDLPDIQVQSTTQVFVVRHAEALQDGTRDPELSPEGLQRAKDLANLLLSQHIRGIYSSPYRRAMATARPLADSLGLEIVTYDPTDSKGLASRVLSEHLADAVLVVGHSNTVPLLVEALGGERPPDLMHDEHDAIFAIRIVQSDPPARVDTVWVHRFTYGEKSEETSDPHVAPAKR